MILLRPVRPALLPLAVVVPRRSRRHFLVRHIQRWSRLGSSRFCRRAWFRVLQQAAVWFVRGPAGFSSLGSLNSFFRISRITSDLTLVKLGCARSVLEECGELRCGLEARHCECAWFLLARHLRLRHAHLGPVVLEFLATVETSHVSLGPSRPRLWRERKRSSAVSAAKKRCN
jgi:hypothetical protein